MNFGDRPKIPTKDEWMKPHLKHRLETEKEKPATNNRGLSRESNYNGTAEDFEMIRRDERKD